MALFIVLERNIPGFDTMMNGKYLSPALDKLDSLAVKLKVRPLSDFFSADPLQVKEFLEAEEIDDSDVPIPPLQQFAAEQGLDTVRALLHHIGSNPDSVPESDGVKIDLQDCERILSVAAANGVKWHMEVDF
jgi:hypothetical protein